MSEMPTADAPNDAWSVFADALQTAGDPRGELIALSIAGDEAARDAYIDEHADALLGPLDAWREQLTVDWTHCLATRVAISTNGPNAPGTTLDAVKAVIEAPLTGMESLSLAVETPRTEPVDVGDAVAWLAENLPDSCPHVELVDARAKASTTVVSADYDPGPNLVELGELAPFWKRESLRAFTLHCADLGQVQFGEIASEHLEQLAIYGLRWPNWGDFDQVVQSISLPALKRLALRLPQTIVYSWPTNDGAYVASERYEEESEWHDAGVDGWADAPDWQADLPVLLGRVAGTPLEHLALTGFLSGRAVLDALVASGILSQLRVLDLSGGDVRDADVTGILENRKAFAGLEVFDLSDTLIRAVHRLDGLGPEIRHSTGSGTRYAFSVGME